VRQPSTFVACHIPHGSAAPWSALCRARCIRSCTGSGGEGNRTPDLVNAIHALSQLSYAPEPLPLCCPVVLPSTLPRRCGLSAFAPRAPTAPAPRRVRREFSLNYSTTARLLASDDDFATEPLNVSASLSSVNRRGLAKFLSAGILHDFDDVRARSREPALGCAVPADLVGGTSDVRSIIAGCRGFRTPQRVVRVVSCVGLVAPVLLPWSTRSVSTHLPF
jgi:hypothetical protein